jgi:hypothetical protein
MFQYQQKNNRETVTPADYKVTSYEPSETYRPNIVMPSAPSTIDKVDFSEAASKAIPSVVYINSISQA